MITRGLAALLCLGLCYLSPIVYANTPDLSIETALTSIAKPAVGEPEGAGEINADDNLWPVQVGASSQEDAQVLWPMMPKDTLAKLAHTFYPNSPILAQRFIQKSMRLSKAIGISIQPDMPFHRAQVIAIPNEKEVRAVTHRIKKREELLTEHNQLLLSYQLKTMLPAKPLTTKNNEHAVKSFLHQWPTAIALPEINIPRITLPTWHAPTMVGITNHLSVIWHHASVQMRYLWQTSKKTVLHWQANVFGLAADQWHQQGITSMLDNPQMRMVILSAGLLLIAVLVWWLQRRYVQRKVALLNSIESTLIEPELVEPTIGELPGDTHYEQVAEHQAGMHANETLAYDRSDVEMETSAIQHTETLPEHVSEDTPQNEDVKLNDAAMRQE